jgi:2-polyprenyl-6-methoxyphenol hydroxylase-like FAD-dependent oxidoreductase
MIIGNANMPPKSPRIAIIGAGLSGLTLGLFLKQKGIPAVLYDKAKSAPRYNYGITLYASTYRPLLKLLAIDELAFRKQVAVDSRRSGIGKVAGSSDSIRCNRGRLEALIHEKLNVTWEKSLQNVHSASGGSEKTLTFEDGSSAIAELLVGCDGPHSATRQTLLPSMELQILPYAVYNGKRRIVEPETMEGILQHFKDSTSIQTRHGNIRLDISINDIKDSQLDLSYTFSRPAKQGGAEDALHRPNRSKEAATETPTELFDELGALHPNLNAPFNDLFDPKQVRDDRLLHWLMRTLVLEKRDIANLASQGIVLIGDAAHATPILGGDGAQTAILDAIALGEAISSEGVEGAAKFAQQRAESGAWIDAVESSKKAIASMHGGEKTHI